MALLSKSMKPAPTLEDKIHSLRSEIDSEIDERVKELKKTCEGVPETVLRNVLTRNSPCQCQAWLSIREADV
jgi:hypothetical protein